MFLWQINAYNDVQYKTQFFLKNFGKKLPGKMFALMAN